MRITMEELNNVPSLLGVWVAKGQPKTMDSYLRIYQWEIKYWHKSRCRLCNKRPGWGYIYKLATRCADHILPEMEYILDEKCHVLGCDKLALHGGNRTQCAYHGGGHRCSLCEQYTVPREGFQCYGCRTGTARVKQFEIMVEEHISQDPELQHYSYRDERIPCAPTPRRPDFVWIGGRTVVVLEVDEHCHVGYERSCEVTRILELHEGFRGKSMILIRFNPLRSLLHELTTLIKKHLQMHSNATPIQVLFLGYPKHLEYNFAAELKILQDNNTIDKKYDSKDEKEDEGRHDSDSDDDFWF